jgi:hypothetical protein
MGDGGTCPHRPAVKSKPGEGLDTPRNHHRIEPPELQ